MKVLITKNIDNSYTKSQYRRSFSCGTIEVNIRKKRNLKKKKMNNKVKRVLKANEIA